MYIRVLSGADSVHIDEDRMLGGSLAAVLVISQVVSISNSETYEIHQHFRLRHIMAVTVAGHDNGVALTDASCTYCAKSWWRCLHSSEDRSQLQRVQ